MNRPDVGDRIKLFDTEYKFQGYDNLHVTVKDPEKNTIHHFGYWEFVEGRIAAKGEV